MSTFTETTENTPIEEIATSTIAATSTPAAVFSATSKTTPVHIKDATPCTAVMHKLATTPILLLDRTPKTELKAMLHSRMDAYSVLLTYNIYEFTVGLYLVSKASTTPLAAREPRVFPVTHTFSIRQLPDDAVDETGALTLQLCTGDNMNNVIAQERVEFIHLYDKDAYIVALDRLLTQAGFNA